MKQNNIFDGREKSNVNKITNQLKCNDTRNVFFDRKHYRGITTMITPSTTCNDILHNHSHDLSSYVGKKYMKEGYNFNIIDINNPFTIIKLQLDSHPYDYLKSPSLHLYYLPIITTEDFDDDTEIASSIEQNQVPSLQVDKSEGIITDKGIYRYNQIKNHFKRKPALLTEKCFSIIKSRTPIIIPINTILEINKCLKYSGQEIKNQIKETTHLIEIKTKDKVYIFRTRTLIKYNHWLNCFNLVRTLLNDEKKDQMYDKALEMNSRSIGDNLLCTMEEIVNIRRLLNQKDYRRYLLTYLNNKQCTDLIENIIMYKSKMIEKDYKKAYDLFTLINNSISSSLNNKDKNNSKCIPIHKYKPSSVKSLSEKINNGLHKNTKNYTQINQVNELMKIDAFDAIYEEIITTIIIPFFAKPISRSLLNDLYTSIFTNDFMKQKAFSLDKMYLLTENQK